MAFALCARGGVDRFQCSLRSGPAAATVARRAELAADCPKIIAPKAGNPDDLQASISGRDECVPSIVFN